MGNLVLKIVAGALAVSVVLGALRMLGTGGVESPTLLVDLCAVLGAIGAIFALCGPDRDRVESDRRTGATISGPLRRGRAAQQPRSPSR
jgi:hypothetical protein